MTSCRGNLRGRRRAALLAFVGVLGFAPAAAAPVRLDTSFAKRGWVGLPYNVSALRALLAVQPDGAVVTTGVVAHGDARTRDDYDFRIQRFTRAGTPDRTFARNGLRKMPLSGEPVGIAIQRDGKIVVALCDPACAPYIIRLGVTSIITRLYRFTRTGALDPSFGTGGVAELHTTGDYRFVNGMTMQRDGKILVVGSIRPQRFGDVPLKPMAMRFLSNGELDPDFGARGLSVFGFVGDGAAAPFHEAAYSVTQGTDGRIIVAGSHGAGLGVAQLTPEGVLDPRFGTLGRVSVPFPSPTWCGSSIVLDRSGRIVVSGGVFGPKWSDFVLTRLLPDGTLDKTFSGDGSVLVDFGSSSRPRYDVAQSLAHDSRGRIIVAGSTITEESTWSQLGVTRLTSTGTVDKTFGGNGRVIPKLPGGYDTWGSTMALWRGKIIVSGKSVVRLTSS